MTEPKNPADQDLLDRDASAERSVTLRDGKRVTLREPTAGELRGIKLLDVLQMDAAAHAELIPRLTDNLTKAGFYTLKPGDMMAIMAEVVGFFAPTDSTGSPSA